MDPCSWLFGAARTRGSAPLSNLGVLGSPPWLFKHRQATNARRGNKTDAGSPRRPPPHDAGTASFRMGAAHEQRMTHAGSRLPAGSLHSERGKHWAKAQAEPDRALEPTRVRSPAGSLTPGGSARPPIVRAVR